MLFILKSYVHYTIRLNHKVEITFDFDNIHNLNDLNMQTAIHYVNKRMENGESIIYKLTYTKKISLPSSP